MASDIELAALRRATDLAPDDATYTDGLLGPLIDSLGINGAAAVIWRELAAKYATMVSTTEAGSSRSMSDLHRHAMEMVDLYEGLAAQDETPVDNLAGASYTWPIERV